MYKVYLVDDEKLILDELKTLIDWETYGFAVCGFQTDPVRAAEEIVRLRPNLVISDIHMAPMNGFALQSKITGELPQIQVCFLTAYDNFDYVQQAMQTGACDYLLKPVEEKHLAALLVNAKRRIVSDATLSFHELFSAGTASERARTNDLFGFYCPLGKGAKRVLSFTDPSGEVKLEEYCKDHCVILHAGGRTVAVCLDLDVGRLQKECFLSGTCEGGASEEFRDVKDVIGFVRQAEYAAEQQFITGKKELVLYRNRADATAKLCAEIGSAKSRQRILEIMETLTERVASEGIQTDGLEKIYASLAHAVSEYNPAFLMADIYRDVRAGGKYESLKELVTAMRAGLALKSEPTFREGLITQVAQDIRERCGVDTSVAEYAQRYGYSVSRFCHIFKEETGSSFQNFVISCRIEKAKEYLTATDLTVAEISCKVGYASYDNFSKIFKKFTGYSPQGYRNRRTDV